MAYTYYKTATFTGGYGSHYQGRIGVEVVSQSITANTSTINIIMQESPSMDAGINSDVATVYLKLDGATKVSTNVMNWQNQTVGTWYTVVSKTGIVVTHDSGGAKTISLQGYCNSGTGYLVYNQTQSITLPQIHGKSTATVTATVDVNGTNAATATITRLDSSYTHTVNFYMGDFATTTRKVTYTGVATSQACPIPTYWLKSIPSTTSGVARVRVETFNGAASIGYNEYNFTITVPSTVIPVVTDIAFARDTTGTDPFNYCVKGISKLNVTGVTLTNQYSATTVNYSYGVHLGANAVATGQLYTETDAAFITDVINTAGSMELSVRSLDSRGRYSAWYGESFTVYDYTAPSLSVMGVRCNASGVTDPAGEYLSASMTVNVSPVNNDNTKTYILEYKKTTDSTWTPIDTSALTGYTGTLTAVRSASSSYSWEIRATITDKLNTVVKTASVTTERTVMDFLSGGTGMAIGKVAETANLFEVALPTQFNGTVSGKALLNAVDSDKKFKIVAGVIENDGAGGWQLISGDHSDINIASVACDTTTITVNYDFTASKVISFVACPDEMFARNGYSFGSSVGLSSAVISVGQSYELGGYVYYNGTAWAKSGAGITSMAFSAGTLTITHASIGGVLASCNCREGVYVASLGALGATTTEIKFKDYAGTLITTADTSMKVYFSRMVSPSQAVNPSTLNIAGANIWCFGIFEVA